MLERRELKGVETMYLSLKIPVELYECFRREAFEKKQTVSLIIQKALEEYVKREGQNERHETTID